ncbi:MAG: hypothetical protein JXB23_13020, partial [Candidatus Aminicenantes bacterium]|nr:hypothetical protein [Candidatus Aminicenantes bacterium]
MRRIGTAIFVICLAAVLTWSTDRLRFEEKETIERTLSFQDSAMTREVQVDNIFGAISVEGHGGQEVRLTVHKTIKARTQDKVAIARRQVTLDITEDGNTIDLYVNGPFRCQNRRKGRRCNHDPGYQVHYNFILK